MNKQGKSLIILILVTLVASVGVLAIIQSRDNNDVTYDTPSQTPTDEPTVDQEFIEESERVVATIIYTDSGFEKPNITVPAGSVIEIIHQSTSDLELASNPHPSHGDNSELNVGLIEPATSVKIKLTKTGTWGYHNHLNDSHGGSITVE